MNTAVITGAASGLGKAIAQHYSGLGWNVIVADINDPAGEEVVAQLNANNSATAFYTHCDISKPQDFDALMNFTRESTGACHLLVNNAGVASAGTLMNSDEDEWERLISLDLMSCVRGCKAFIPLIKESASAGSHSAIVNIASFAGLALMPGMATYNVAKAGVIALSETLRCELYKDHIHVAVACPSFFKTNLTQSMDTSDDATKQRINKWMETSGVTAEMVADDIAKAVSAKKFMILSHGYTRKIERIMRWFPNYMRKKKLDRPF